PVRVFRPGPRGRLGAAGAEPRRDRAGDEAARACMICRFAGWRVFETAGDTNSWVVNDFFGSKSLVTPALAAPLGRRHGRAAVRALTPRRCRPEFPRRHGRPNLADATMAPRDHRLAGTEPRLPHRAHPSPRRFRRRRRGDDPGARSLADGTQTASQMGR